MKTYFYTILALLGLTLNVVAADKVVTSAVSAATPLTLLTGGKYTVKTILYTPTSTNGSFYFYDSAANSTTYVAAAYTSYAKYATNYSVTFTNAAGIVMTNTFVGEATLPTSVAASTNERPKIIGPYLVPTTGRTISSLRAQPELGLTIYATAAGQVEVIYEQNAP